MKNMDLNLILIFSVDFYKILRYKKILLTEFYFGEVGAKNMQGLGDKWEFKGSHA